MWVCCNKQLCKEYEIWLSSACWLQLVISVKHSIYSKAPKQWLLSLTRRIMFSVVLVCLFVSNITQKSYERIAMKFYGEVRGGKRNKWLNVGSDPDDHADYPTGNSAITQQSMSRFWWNFQDSSAVIQGTLDKIFSVIWIIMLTFQIANPGCMGPMGVTSCFVGDLHSLLALVINVEYQIFIGKNN